MVQTTVRLEEGVADGNAGVVVGPDLVKKPTALTLADIRSRPRQEVTFTVECSGNTGLPFFNGA